MPYQGFEVELEFYGNQKFYARLMGAGGLLGDGLLASVNAGSLPIRKACQVVTRRARARLARYGHLHRLISWDLPLDQRLEVVRPVKVLGARAILNATK